MLGRVVNCIQETKQSCLPRDPLRKVVTDLRSRIAKSFDQVFHVFIAQEEGDHKNLACEFIENDVNQASLWQMPCVFRSTITTATETIETVRFRGFRLVLSKGFEGTPSFQLHHQHESTGAYRGRNQLSAAASCSRLTTFPTSGKPADKEKIIRALQF